LYYDEVCIDADEDAAGCEHDDDPEVELPVGPVVGLADDDSFATTAENTAAGHFDRLIVEYVSGKAWPRSRLCVLPLTSLKWW